MNPLAIWRRAARSEPWRGAAVAGILLVGAILGAIGTGDNDLGAFFLPAARLAANGHPLALYTVRSDGVPPDDGPLPLLALGALLRLFTLLGLGAADSVALRATLGVLGAAGLLLAAREALLAAERLRGAPLGRLGQGALLVIAAANPTIWRGLAHYGHIELALALWLTLRAARAVAADRPGWAGLWLGLALLSRSTTGLAILALALALLAERRWRDTARLVVVSALTTALGLAPFLVARPVATLYALVGYRGGLPVGAGSIWVIVIDTPLESIVQRFGTLVIILGAVTLCALALRRVAPQGAAPGAITRSPTLYALLTLALLAFPLLSGMVWPYYYIEAIIPAAIFGATLSPGYPDADSLLLPLALSLGGLYGEATLEFPPFEPIGYLLGLAQCGALLLLIRWTLRRLPREAAKQRQTGG